MIGNTIKTGQGTYRIIDKILYPQVDITRRAAVIAVTAYLCVYKEKSKRTIIINPDDIIEIL